VPPIAPIFVAYVAGVLSGLPGGRDFLFPWALPAFFFLLAVWMARAAGRVSLSLVFLALPLGVYLAGADNGGRLPPGHVLHHLKDGDRATIRGRLMETPRVFPDRVRFTVELDQLDYGEGETAVTGSLSRVEGVTSLGAFPLPPIARAEARLKENMDATIHRLFPGERGALLSAMLTGAKEGLATESREAYAVTGLAHLMAVSGLHIGFVAGAAFFLLEPLLFFLLSRFSPDRARAGAARTLAALFSFVPVLFYLLLASGQVSAVRAGIMVAAVLLAMVTHREGHLASALLWAALLILLFRPGALQDVSFQLSFAAVATILTAFHVLKRADRDPLERLGEPGLRLRLLYTITGDPHAPPPPSLARAMMQKASRLFLVAAFVSLVVFIGTLPVVVFHFNRLSLAGLVLNPLLVPVASLLIPLALFSLSATLVLPSLIALVKPLLALPLTVFHAVPLWAAEAPFAALSVPTPSELWIVLYYAALTIGGVSLTLLHPPPAFRPNAAGAAGGRIDNNLPLVMRIDYRDFSMLLTGDIGEEAEQYLLGQGAPLKADVLKGPHHGSRHSSHPAFIEAVAPKAVIFSSRDKIPWRHPHPEVLARYEKAGSAIWRTDESGAVQIETDGSRMEIRGTVQP